MRYPCVVFDFDGTLADTFAEAVSIMRRIGPDLGLREVDPELARGMPTRQFMKALGVSFWRLPRVVRAFQAAAAESAPSLKLFDQIPHSLRQLHSSGIRLGILSSNREDTIRTCLKNHGVEGLFEFVIGYPKLFGKGRALRRIRRSLRIERAAMLYVGDETRDVIAARKARIDNACVAWGFQNEALLRESGATTVFQTPSELVAYLLKMTDADSSR